MMKINRNNYEVFIIDYYDGKLSSEEQSELWLFLEANPDLKAEAEIFEQSLPVPEIEFSRKDSLKKREVKAFNGINEDNYENYFIAYFEGDLTQTEKQSLSRFLGLNPWLRDEFEITGQLKIEPDKSQVFGKKNELKKKAVSGVFYYAVAVAAVLLIFFAIYPLVFKKSVNNPDIQISSIATPKQVTPDSASDMQATPEIMIIEEPKNEIITSLTNMERNVQMSKLTTLKSLGIAYNTNEIFEYAEPLEINKPENKSSASTTLLQNEKSTALGRIVNKNIEGIASVFKKGKRQKKENNEPVIVKMLDQSLIVFNTLTGSDAGLTKIYDQQGQLLSYGIDGELLKINRQVTRPNN